MKADVSTNYEAVKKLGTNEARHGVVDPYCRCYSELQLIVADLVRAAEK